MAEAPTPGDVPELLLELGEVQLQAANGDAHATLHRAWELCTDRRAAARVALAVSRASRAGGSYAQAEQIVLSTVAALGDTEPELVDDLHTELALCWRLGPGHGRPSAERVGRLAARAAARGQDAVSRLLRLAALDCLRSPDAEPEAAVVAAQAVAAEPPDASALYPACGVLVAYDRLDVLAEAADAVAEAAQACGRLLDLGIALTMRAQSRFLTGALEKGEEDTRMADRAAGGLDPLVRRHTQAWLLHCLVEQGRPEEAERELVDSGVPVTLGVLLMARARVRMALGRPDEALTDLQECERWLRRRRVVHPNAVPWRAWSAVATLQVGDPQRAHTQAVEALEAARRFRSARAEGLALWALGLVEQRTDLLADAVTVLQRVQAPVERARALIDLGAALRRANRRVDAREHLTSGLQIAHDCGAGGLSTLARAELAATGVHIRRPAVVGPAALTPTERRIADLAARGASNREIAQSLFVTPKTVENHLGNVYRKLAVAGRSALTEALRGEPSTRPQRR